MGVACKLFVHWFLIFLQLKDYCPAKCYGLWFYPLGDIAVLWDNKSKDAEVEKIKFNSGSGNNEVKITDEPRVMKKDEMIAVGCTVKRGKHLSFDLDDNSGMYYNLTPLE